MTPGDELEKFLPDPESSSIDPNTRQQQIKYWTEKLGIDLPVFYLSVDDGAVQPERLNKHVSADHASTDFSDQPEINHRTVSWFPCFHFHADNKFHRWLFGDGRYSKGILRGDLGISYVKKIPVSEMIGGALKWSATISLFALTLAFLISIPIGLHSASVAGSRTDRSIVLLTIILDSLPAFTVAMLLLMVFANPNVLGWLPAAGTAPARVEEPGFMDRISYLVLPVSTFVITISAFLIRSIRDTALSELKTDHIRTARAKGQVERSILNVHVLGNLLPGLLTLFGHAIPFALSGSVLIESVFGITTGMGALITASVAKLDYPVLSAIFLMTAVTSLTVQFLIDVLIARIDPRTTVTLQTASRS